MQPELAVGQGLVDIGSQGEGRPPFGRIEPGGDGVQFIENAAGTSVTLGIPSTGLSRTFNGPTRSDVDDQITAFLKKDGADELAKFLKAMNRQSLVSVTDGNPNSATARAASQSFSSYGMTDAETRDEKDDSDEGGSRSGFGMIADVGTIDANGIKGQVYSLKRA